MKDVKSIDELSSITAVQPLRKSANLCRSRGGVIWVYLRQLLQLQPIGLLNREGMAESFSKCIALIPINNSTIVSIYILYIGIVYLVRGWLRKRKVPISSFSCNVSCELSNRSLHARQSFYSLCCWWTIWLSFFLIPSSLLCSVSPILFSRLNAFLDHHPPGVSVCSYSHPLLYIEVCLLHVMFAHVFKAQIWHTLSCTGS